VHRRPVESASLASIGYDSNALTLEVEFKHGGVYRYLNVPADLFEALLSAESKGTFLNTTIKNSYPFMRGAPDPSPQSPIPESLRSLAVK